MKQSLCYIILLFFLTCSPKKAKEMEKVYDQIAPIAFNTKISILFVQWQYPYGMDILKAMDIRHDLENKIDAALKVSHIGEWIAGDMGPGGANMEYGIKFNPIQAIKIILNILHENGLSSASVIATDIDYSSNKWHYKILYPKSYTKELNPL